VHGSRRRCAARIFFDACAGSTNDADRYDPDFRPGWGVREKSPVLAFTYAGVAPSDGFLISVLLGATMFAIGIGGASCGWRIARASGFQRQ
jgi:hypothetical protein